jgi:hypothetical protein
MLRDDIGSNPICTDKGGTIEKNGNGVAGHLN